MFCVFTWKGKKGLHNAGLSETGGDLTWILGKHIPKPLPSLLINWARRQMFFVCRNLHLCVRNLHVLQRWGHRNSSKCKIHWGSCCKGGWSFSSDDKSAIAAWTAGVPCYNPKNILKYLQVRRSLCAVPAQTRQVIWRCLWKGLRRGNLLRLRQWSIMSQAGKFTAPTSN